MTNMNIDPENLRLQQLQLMGITSYFPRFALPGALPSEQRSWGAEDEPAAAGAPFAHVHESLPPAEWQYGQQAGAAPATATTPARAGPAHDGRIGKESLQAELSQKEPVQQPVLQKEQAQKEQAQKSTVPDENAGDVLSLHLLLIPVDASLCVLNQIPVLAKSLLQEKQRKLLENILFFLGKPPAAYDSVRTFRWPLPGMSNITSADAAKSSLMHFLEQFSQEHTFSNLLVLGEQGAEWMVAAARVHADKNAAEPPWQMLHTYSLDQMLTLPSIKREVWQHLLPLQARFKQA